MKKEQRYTKFKIGDYVEYFGYNVSCESARERWDKRLVVPVNDERHLKVGEIYKVVAIKDTDYGFFIDIQGKDIRGDNVVVHGCSSSNFIKNNNVNNTKMKITNLVKKILDVDTRKLVQAGFINGDLALTDEGVSELVGILFLEKKTELVKIAEEKLKDEKED